MAAPRIAIIGFGFSGLMVAANLVRKAAAHTILYIVADDLSGQGLAYSTRNPSHLLNVPAGKMGAFSEALDGFLNWLQTPDAAVAKQALGITAAYTATDFVPRALYAQYLQSIWKETQEIAAQQNISLKLVEATATAIQMGAELPVLAVLTARGDAIAVDDIILATGNENGPVMAQLPPAQIIQNPWAKDAFAGAAKWASPILLMGVGLTGVDTILMLRSNDYKGEIIAFSRHGLLPQRHAPATRIFNFDKDALFAQKSLQHMLRFVRTAIVEQAGDWRVVIDALRPHTQGLWQRFSAQDKQRFLKRLRSLWGTHRHRMAPEIADQVAAEIMRGGVRIVACKKPKTEVKDDKLEVRLNGETFHPSRLINCTGPQLNPEKSATTIMKQAIADGIVEAHGTHLGIATDPQLRVWGNAYPHVYAMGPLLTGQLLESTAVPELRVQAAQIAASLTA